MIYEYKCTICENITELEKSIKDDIPKTIECPICKEKGLLSICKRVYSTALHVPDHMSATRADPDWCNRYHKRPKGLKSKYF